MQSSRDDAATPDGIDLQRDVQSILHERCYLCHGPSQQMSGLRLDRREDALRGGDSGVVIVARESAVSRLIERITSDKEGFGMPPVGEALMKHEIGRLRAWIDKGAAAATTTRTPSACGCGGIRGGYVHGKTDDVCLHVAEDPMHVHDLQATMLHLLGFDHTKLTYRHMGRDFRLSDVAGRVVEELLV